MGFLGIALQPCSPAGSLLVPGDGVPDEPQFSHVVADIRRAPLDLTHKLFVNNGFRFVGDHRY